MGDCRRDLQTIIEEESCAGGYVPRTLGGRRAGCTCMGKVYTTFTGRGCYKVGNGVEILAIEKF